MKKILLLFCGLICIFRVNLEAKCIKECPSVQPAPDSEKHFYVGGGVGTKFPYLSLKMKDCGEERSTRGIRLISTFVTGGGAVIPNSKIYLGGEVSVDATKNYSKVLDIPGACTYKIRENGFTPSVYIRAGYKYTNNLVPYVKVGATFKNNKIISETIQKSMNKTLLDVALGVESPVCKSFSARIEGGYAFKGGKNVNVDGVDLKFKNKGSFSLRAMTMLHI